MSLSSRETIKCPLCGHESEMTVWHSITVHTDPDLKEDLLKGRVNIFTCPACQKRGHMPTPLLYHDEEKRLMISFSHSTNETFTKRLFEQVKESSRESGELKNLQNYNLRFVNEFNSLLEKILIFDAGLSDKTIEVIKLMVLLQDAEKATNRSCVFGKLENGIIEFMIHDDVENQLYTSGAPMETYEKIDRELRTSGVKPYSFDWEMINRDFALKCLGLEE